MSEKKIPDGGPAFPCGPDGGYGPWPGMTLRDWFAGQVLLGIISSTRISDGMATAKACAAANYVSPSQFEKEVEFPAYATASFRIADAMLKARKA